MAKNPEKDQKDPESEVWSAIAAFEQILDAMPNDRASLEALSHAYEQIGDLTKAKDYTIRLGNVLLDEGDTVTAGQLLPKVKQYAADDADAAELLARLEKTAPAEVVPEPGTPDSQPAVEVAPETHVRSSFSMADELSFAWNLMEAGELTQEEYASVVQDLTEMSAGDSAATISVLHALESRGFKGLEKIIGYVVEQCDTPIISLSNFDLQPDCVNHLPMIFMVQRGAFIFDVVGNHGLCVVMNPYDQQLRKDVAAQSGMTCHFFVTVPAEFDQALQKISEMLVEIGEG